MMDGPPYTPIQPHMRHRKRRKENKAELYANMEHLSAATTNGDKDSRGHVIRDKEHTLLLLHLREVVDQQLRIGRPLSKALNPHWGSGGSSG